VAGIIDRAAPSVEAEYVRFLEGDYLGKVIFWNFCTNIAGIKGEDIFIPIGKWGDVLNEHSPSADARVRIGKKWLNVEIKLARINIANKTIGQTAPNWAFGYINRSPGRKPKSYDLLFAVGIEILGFEQEQYWEYLRKVSSARTKAGYRTSDTACPSEREYLNLCGFFLMTRDSTPNYFRVTLKSIETNQYKESFAWGWDKVLLRNNWDNVVSRALSNKRRIDAERR